MAGRVGRKTKTIYQVMKLIRSQKYRVPCVGFCGGSNFRPFWRTCAVWKSSNYNLLIKNWCIGNSYARYTWPTLRSQYPVWTINLKKKKISVQCFMHLSICNINRHTTGIWHPPLPRDWEFDFRTAVRGGEFDTKLRKVGNLTVRTRRAKRKC